MYFSSVALIVVVLLPNGVRRIVTTVDPAAYDLSGTDTRTRNEVRYALV